MKQSFHLPWPPTANSMWRHVRAGQHYLCERYRKWKKEAGLELLAQRVKRVTGPVSVTIELRAPNKQTWDLDNRVKPVLDLLVEHLIITDDNSEVVREIVVKAGDEMDVGARVNLTRLESESP